MQLTVAYPSASRGWSSPSQEILVPDTSRHADGGVSTEVPEVIVLSVKFPLELRVHDPDTWSDPVTGTVVQPIPSPVKSAFPLTLRQDDVTFQVATALPPQAVPLEHDPAPPPPLEVPPAPPDPLLEVPPVPDGVLDVGLHAPEIIANAIANTRAADCTFIERSPSKGGTCRALMRWNSIPICPTHDHFVNEINGIGTIHTTDTEHPKDCRHDADLVTRSDRAAGVARIL